MTASKLSTTAIPSGYLDVVEDAYDTDNELEVMYEFILDKGYDADDEDDEEW